MEYEIGQVAGQVWRHLSEKSKQVALTDIPKAMKLKTQVAYMALGWLAREGKLTFSERGGKLHVGLSTSECTM